MDKLEKIIKSIRQKFGEFNKARFFSFNDVVKENGRPIKGKYEFPGVYIINKIGKDKDTIYIGMTGRGIKYRLADLFFYDSRKKRFKHTLTKKLIMKRKLFRSIDEVANFYRKKCRLRTIKTKSAREARIIEDVLVELFNPEYNQE